MNGKTIYGVCSGEHEQWFVSMLCETREQAEDAIEEMGGGYEIEEFDFYPEGNGPGVHRVYKAEGLEGCMDVRVESWRQFGDVPSEPQVEEVAWRGIRSEHPISVTAKCADQGSAVKAVKERLEALKASGDWQPLEPGDAGLLDLNAALR